MMPNKTAFIANALTLIEFVVESPSPCSSFTAYTVEGHPRTEDTSLNRAPFTPTFQPLTKGTLAIKDISRCKLVSALEGSRSTGNQSY